VIIDAWGHDGPWAARRGFDSVIQAATGLAAGESPDGIEPGALPCQLLDHGTGYLAAAATFDRLRRQHRHGGTVVRRVSLARTAWWIATTPAGPEGQLDLHEETGGFQVEVPTDGHTIVAVAPPGNIGTEPLRWYHSACR
jgi:CoA-transferase family III